MRLIKLGQAHLGEIIGWVYVLAAFIVAYFVADQLKIYNDPFTPFFIYLLPALIFLAPKQAITAMILTMVGGNILFLRGSVFNILALIAGDIEIIITGSVIIALGHLIRLTRRQAREIIILEQEKLRSQAEEAYRLRRNEFLVIAAHELKTPLTVITLYADLMETTQGDIHYVNQAAGTILKESEHITAVVEEILAEFEPNL